MQVAANRYLSEVSSSSEGNIGIEEESETCSLSRIGRLTRGQRTRRKFNKRMKFFLAQGGSCSYDDEMEGDIDVPLRYQHLQKHWVPKELPPINTNFCVNERIYRIAPSSLHGLGLFSMDGIKVSYNKVSELMEYVGPCYDYKSWMHIVQYKKSMRRYALSANYIQQQDNNQSKSVAIYIDGRPKATGNIVGFINSTRPGSTIKQPNCIFEAREGNRVFICAIKSIRAGEELLIDYNLNRIDTNEATIMGVVHTIKPTSNQ